MSPNPSSVSSSPTTESPTPSVTPSPTSAVDVSAAAKAALGLWAKYPNNLNDPSAGYFWSGVPLAKSPMSKALKARLIQLRAAGYFSDQDGKCGEDYINGTQDALPSEPKVVSAEANANGMVAVVVARSPKPPPPNLTVTMTERDGVWLATDLASGTGPSASIFSRRPNC